MTKEELSSKMDIECPGCEISDDYPAPLLYRLYRMYSLMQEYRDGVIFVNECDDPCSDVLLTMTLTSEDQHDGPWAKVKVFKDGSWETDGYLVERPLDMNADINEEAENAAMDIFAADLPPLF